MDHELFVLLLVHTLRSFLSAIGNRPPHMEGKKRLKQTGNHAKLLGGSFAKLGNLGVRLVLGPASADACICPPEF